MALLGAQFVNAVSPNPVGSLQAYAGASAPSGWLLCDGTSYSTSVYPELYSVLGYTYGGSGANFNVPDLRGRAPIGAGTGAQNGGSGSGAISGGTALTARARGAFGGDERLQSHTHISPGQNLATLYNSGGSPLQGWNAPGVDGLSNSTTDHSRTGKGSGENMPPFLVTNYIIKAIPDAPRSGLAYGSTPPIVTALPANPQFGDVVTYIADATNGVAWNLQYDATGTYPWKFIGGAPLLNTVAASEATANPSYVALTTAGPQITVPVAGDYDVLIGCNFNGGAGNDIPGVMSFLVGGTAASDSDAVWISTRGPGFDSTISKPSRKTGIAASTALVARYKSPVSAGMIFSQRFMRVTPIRVSA